MASSGVDFDFAVAFGFADPFVELFFAAVPFDFVCLATGCDLPVDAGADAVSCIADSGAAADTGAALLFG